MGGPGSGRRRQWAPGNRAGELVLAWVPWLDCLPEALKVHRRTLLRWCAAASPTITAVQAERIEQVTGGAVPAHSWAEAPKGD